MQKYIKKKAGKVLNSPKFSIVTNLFSPLYSGIGSVLMFHRIVPHEKDIILDNMELTAAQLEKTIRYFLEKNYEIVSIEKAHKIIKGIDKVDKKFVVFTFDDGYKDNYTVAYPIFKKYNVPFTIYITTCFPNKTALIWWYPLEELIRKHEIVDFKFEDKNYYYRTETPEQKKEVAVKLREFILSLKIERQKKLFSILFDENGIEIRKSSDSLAMDWDDIKELAKSELVTIGAHTSNHYNLKNLDPESVRKEIRNSKKEIESHIGKAVEHFAYPFGSANEAGKREFGIAEEIGLKTSSTTRSGNIFKAHSQYTHCLPRITPSPDLLATFPQIYTSGFVPAFRQKFRRVITK